MEVRKRSIEYILRHWGPIGDLPKSVVPVVWVTVFQGLAVGDAVEQAGGERGLLRDMLMDGGKLGLNLREATLRLQFLDKMVPIIRAEVAQGSQEAADLVVDILKWKILDAGSMGTVRRAFARSFAKADPEYRNPVPAEIM